MRKSLFLPLITAAFSLAPFPATVRAATANPDVATPPKWSDIDDCTYDMRARFLAGLKRLEARVDSEVRELDAKRATLKGTAQTQDWDFAMKEMRDSQAYLKSMGEEIGGATDETWDQEKDKVNAAWVRTQAAYDKVRSSTTR